MVVELVVVVVIFVVAGTWTEFAA